MHNITFLTNCVISSYFLSKSTIVMIRCSGYFVSFVIWGELRMSLIVSEIYWPLVMLNDEWKMVAFSEYLNFTHSPWFGVEEISCSFVKVGFFQKVMAKFFNLSKCHSCEPKIVLKLLIPVNDNIKPLVILWTNLVLKSPH